MLVSPYASEDAQRVSYFIVHNFYQQPGGEDQVFCSEAGLLELHNHQVHRYTVHNETIRAVPPLSLAAKTIWNSETYKTLRTQFRELRPRVLHVHNTLPLISPSVYYAAKDEGVAVVQTLHNFRLSCVNGLFYRDGQVCEDCLGQLIPISGVRHRCYRGSRVASGAVAAMLAFHNVRRTFVEMIDTYIALTDFAKEKFVQAGLPTHKIAVKPNFLDRDPGVGLGNGGYALFVGRLSPEKGLDTLFSAWSLLAGKLPLKVVGDGPLGSQVARASQELEGVEWLGKQPREKVLEIMKDASLLVFPSTWYEGFPMTLVEAFAVGLPVVASRLGSMASLVNHGRTGLLFSPGLGQELADAITGLLANPARLAEMRRAARREYEDKYTAARNYEQLMSIYDDAIRRNSTPQTS